MTVTGVVGTCQEGSLLWLHSRDLLAQTADTTIERESLSGYHHWLRSPCVRCIQKPLSAPTLMEYITVLHHALNIA